MESILKELKETWGYDTTELNHIKEILEEVAFDSYWMGYRDREAEDETERAYYAGFSAYGKKEDYADWTKN
jgi:hypothetical protein